MGIWAAVTAARHAGGGRRYHAHTATNLAGQPPAGPPLARRSASAISGVLSDSICSSIALKGVVSWTPSCYVYTTYMYLLRRVKLLSALIRLPARVYAYKA